ncbi:MAG: sugar phosphate isomerase/epimerase [Oscillospiraceae bacterium]|nr:sugar phosphate isomerase/epimerase [Oscillospiraceae bacterium]
MYFGLFNNEIDIADIRENFEFIASLGCTTTQFDFINLLGDSIPGSIEAGMIDDIIEGSKRSGVTVCAVSGTYNMAHPDEEYRKEYRNRLPGFFSACRKLGSQMVTLCTGTRSTEFMWKYSPDNSSEKAWTDMTDEVKTAVKYAEAEGLVLGVECEAANIISNPDKARKLLDEVGSPSLKMILDGANLFDNGIVSKERSRETLGRAFELLSDDIRMAHGKDIKAGSGIDFCPAGRGTVDFEYMLQNLIDMNFDGPMIIHGIRKMEDFAPAVTFMRSLYDRLSR